MVSITISVSEEIRDLMKKFPEVNWSALVRKVISEKAKLMLIKEEMLSELKKEEEFIDWSVELGRKAKKGRLQRLNENNNR
jgi:hypothetical protein